MLILLGRGVGVGILERAGVRADTLDAADEVDEGVRVRKPDGGVGGTAGAAAADAERSIVLDGKRRNAGLGCPRQLVAVGGSGKSSLPNSSAPGAAPGSDEGVRGRLSGWVEGVRGSDWDDTLVLSRFEDMEQRESVCVDWRERCEAGRDWALAKSTEDRRRRSGDGASSSSLSLQPSPVVKPTPSRRLRPSRCLTLRLLSAFHTFSPLSLSASPRAERLNWLAGGGISVNSVIIVERGDSSPARSIM
jgi:hypothetical protein